MKVVSDTINANNIVERILSSSSYVNASLLLTATGKRFKGPRNSSNRESVDSSTRQRTALILEATERHIAKMKTRPPRD